MIDVNDLRKGVTFELDGKLYKVLDYQHNKPGRGNATIRIKARDLRSGTTLEKTFNSGTSVQDARLEFHNNQYLYRDGDIFYFMDTETYEQFEVPQAAYEDKRIYMKDGDSYRIVIWDNEPIDIKLPMKEIYVVTEAEEAVKGDTVTGTFKTVTVETGLKVKVPLFIKTGEKVLVNTETGDYVERVNS